LLLQELLLEVDKLLVDALEAVDDLLYLLARADELLLEQLNSTLALFGRIFAAFHLLNELLGCLSSFPLAFLLGIVDVFLSSLFRFYL